jgi:hypothetical protein
VLNFFFFFFLPSKTFQSCGGRASCSRFSGRGLRNLTAILLFHPLRADLRLDCFFLTSRSTFYANKGVDQVAGLCHCDSYSTRREFSLCSPPGERLRRVRSLGSQSQPGSRRGWAASVTRAHVPRFRSCGAATHRVPRFRALPAPQSQNRPPRRTTRTTPQPQAELNQERN